MQFYGIVVVFSLVWIAVFLWHIKENQSLNTAISSVFPYNVYRKVMRQAWLRSLQVMMLLTLAMVTSTVFIEDMQEQERQKMASLEEAAGADKTANATSEAPNIEEIANAEPQPVILMHTDVADSMNRLAPASNTPAAVPETPPLVSENTLPSGLKVKTPEQLIADAKAREAEMAADAARAEAEAKPEDVPVITLAEVKVEVKPEPKAVEAKKEEPKKEEAKAEPKKEEPKVVAEAPKKEEPKVLTVAKAEPEVATPASSPVKELFTADGNASDLAKLDEMKQRYENLFIHYLYLSQCGMAVKDDYLVLSNALSAELASVNGPGRLHHDIYNAAKGSYDEVYATVPCENPATAKQAAQFKAYVNAVKLQQ